MEVNAKTTQFEKQTTDLRLAHENFNSLRTEEVLRLNCMGDGKLTRYRWSNSIIYMRLQSTTSAQA